MSRMDYPYLSLLLSLSLLVNLAGCSSDSGESEARSDASRPPPSSGDALYSDRPADMGDTASTGDVNQGSDGLDVINPPLSADANSMDTDMGSELPDSQTADSNEMAPVGENLLFASGFEPNTTVQLESTGKRAKDIRGVDQQTGFDWEADLEANGREFFMNYVDGTDGQNPEMLGSLIAEDPEDASNQVLYTWQHDSEWHQGGYWSRVQGELAEYDFPAIYYKVRFRLDEDIAVVNTNEWRIWCMLGIEIRPKENPSDHSLSVRLGKSASTDALEWGIHYRNPIDGATKIDTGTPAKFGQWQTLEFYAKTGDEQTGRIWLAIDGETLVDERARTVQDEVVWSKVQPLKVYGNIVDIVTDPEKGAKPTLKVWFDDFEIWTEPPMGVLP